jgi:hypothetical protein
MRVTAVVHRGLTAELSFEELEIINNALNEVCNGLDVWDFPIRMGAEKPEVLKLLHQVSTALDERRRS